jgi:ribosomal protein S18 acetylase RimI-like enzyme
MFRFATQNDADAIARLVNFVYRGESGARAWTGEAHLLGGQRTDANAIGGALNDSRVRIILSFSDTDSKQTFGRDEPIGCVMVRAEGDRCYLGMLTVHVDLQKSGLGSRLVAEAERVARQELGCSSMFMHVISLRTELINWYERRDYMVSEARAPFPYGDERFGVPKRDDLEFVILKKAL